MSKTALISSVAIDNNVLVNWVSAPEASLTKLRLEYFFERIEQSKQRLVIPAPVVAEFLAVAEDARFEFVNKLRQSSFVIVASFDFRAAVECSILIAAARNSGDIRYGGDSAKQKIKVDEQIVAIARVNQASLIISNDNDVRKIAGRFNIASKTIEELDLPEKSKQTDLEFNKHS